MKYKLTELPDKWRTDPVSEATDDPALTRLATYMIGVDRCSNELELALPKPTRFTRDKRTWPDNFQDIVYRFHHAEFGWGVLYAMEWTDGEIDNEIIGAFWWPTCGLFKRPDTPPEGD